MSSNNARLPVPIKKDLRHRFYCAVVFLAAVTGACETNRQRAPPSPDAAWPPPPPPPHDGDAPIDAPVDALFRAFVDRLCQFCDVKLGGDSVTALAVLDLPDRVQYRFACNRLNRSRLARTARFLTDLLRALRAAAAGAGVVPPDPGPDMALLQMVLVHCRTRVHSYLGYFAAACRACVRTRPADAACLDQLRQLLRAASDADFKSMAEDEFTRRCRHLMGLVETAHAQQPGTGIFAGRAAHGSMHEGPSCWADLRHYAGRLVSYAAGVRALARAAAAFPRLLEGFEVVALRSSEPDENPLRGLFDGDGDGDGADGDGDDAAAERLLARVVPGGGGGGAAAAAAAAAAHYGALVREARSLDLGAGARAAAAGGALRPVVHAELLVLGSLERDGLTHPSRFYNAWRYIGASKPACRLCSLYVQAHRGGFRVRPSHGNLYAGWKPPDVFRRDGEAAVRARTDVLNRMVDPLRAEALRVLTEKVPLGRRHDSSTGMTLPTRAAHGGQDAGAGDGEGDVETVFGDADEVASG